MIKNNKTNGSKVIKIAHLNLSQIIPTREKQAEYPFLGQLQLAQILTATEDFLCLISVQIKQMFIITMNSPQKKGQNNSNRQQKEEKKRKLSLPPLENIEEVPEGDNCLNLLRAGPVRRGRGVSWSPEENLKYCNFLSIYADISHFDQFERKEMGIHKEMSKFIGSRSPKQCRSHHQKMLNKFGKVSQVILTIRRAAETMGKQEKRQLINYNEFEKKEEELSIWQEILNCTSNPNCSAESSEGADSSLLSS